MCADDAPWAAGLMERRRQQYARYSPVFWRPAQGVTPLHARFLRRQISAGNIVAVRTGHGFLIAGRRGGEGFVDDFAVDAEGTWDGDGAALLLAAAHRLAAAGGVGAMRVVTAHADVAKAGMLRRLSLSLAEQWWVLPVRPTGQMTSPGRVQGGGFPGILGPAPPVYDPGGPVFQPDRVADGADVALIAREAAALGAVLAVVAAAPGSALSAGLRGQGWSIASDWYLGWPASAHGH